MKNEKIHIIDDVFDDETVLEIVEFATTKIPYNGWTLKELGKDEVPSAIQKMYDFASLHYDLSESRYLEFWKHQNTRPDWHYDCDEVWLMRTGQYRFPLNTIVYYPKIEDLVGGDFITDSVRVTPKTNRMIILSPGIHHCVEPFESGFRMSFNINPWSNNIASTDESHKRG